MVWKQDDEMINQASSNSTTAIRPAGLAKVRVASFRQDNAHH